MNPMQMTESDFGLERGRMPEYSDGLVADVQSWMERELTDEEKARLRDLCQGPAARSEKMNTPIERAKALAEKNPGYSYNPAILAQIIEAGILPEGVVLMAAGGMAIKREGNEAVCYRGAVAAKRSQIDSAARESLLVSYAVLASQTSQRMGA